MFKFITRFLKKFKKKIYITPPFYPYGKKSRFRIKLKKAKVKEFKPPFPGGTFVYPDSWYESWNNNLLDEGWTKKELKQGWRWVK